MWPAASGLAEGISPLDGPRSSYNVESFCRAEQRPTLIAKRSDVVASTRDSPLQIPNVERSSVFRAFRNFRPRQREGDVTVLIRLPVRNEFIPGQYTQCAPRRVQPPCGRDRRPPRCSDEHLTADATGQEPSHFQLGGVANCDVVVRQEEKLHTRGNSLRPHSSDANPRGSTNVRRMQHRCRYWRQLQSAVIYYDRQ